MTKVNNNCLQGSKGENVCSKYDGQANFVSSNFSNSTACLPIADKLPTEIVKQIVSFLDGKSLLTCATVSSDWEKMTHQRQVWRKICISNWPNLCTQRLAQLPGAPDYELIRLYKGCWKNCFIQQHSKNQRASIQMTIQHFSKLDASRIVSESFSIGEHTFCLWIFPRGNPHEPEYVGQVLSVYLVLTDLKKRREDWVTCAVFSISVVNHLNPNAGLIWNSCLGDNRFNANLFNWGVHSLGRLDNILEHESGYLEDDALTLNASVRIMSITFRVVEERHIHQHSGYGLCGFDDEKSFELPFCCTVQELVDKIEEILGIPSADVLIWCFNQPVTTGKSLRPRKLLNFPGVDVHRPMFGNLLTDGIDIDAYSFCRIYAANTKSTNVVLNRSITDNVIGNIFVKRIDAITKQLKFVGQFSITAHATTKHIYECIQDQLDLKPASFVLRKEAMIPTTQCMLIPSSDTLLLGDQSLLDIADIVIIEPTGENDLVSSCLKQSLTNHYNDTYKLLNKKHGMLTLEDVENMGEKLDILKFRIRGVFRKCDEDARKTLQYIMEGRHLGFICDSCGQTDFKGVRYNCTICNDYDLCHQCNAKANSSNHRYANIGGKWQRLYDFNDHSSKHAMNRIEPVFLASNPTLH